MTNGSWPGRIIDNMERMLAERDLGPSLEVQFDNLGGPEQQTPYPRWTPALGSCRGHHMRKISDIIRTTADVRGMDPKQLEVLSAYEAFTETMSATTAWSWTPSWSPAPAAGTPVDACGPARTGSRKLKAVPCATTGPTSSRCR